MLNDFYQGDYAVLHDGEGEVSIGGRTSSRKDGILHVELSGKGQGLWLNIHRSKSGNPVRNIRILPAAQASAAAVPTFHPGFLKGLQSMQSLRFMDWMGINASPQKKWADRVKVSEYTQAGERGISIEHALELANLLKADPWFCMPHQADDDYILRFSRLIKERLHPSLKVYVEYSNEIWNWGFAQAHWVGTNAPGADPAISTALRQVGKTYCQDEADYCHPEKDAHMMDRTFRLWRTTYTGADTARMVRVAGVQHAWYDNTGRILKYLFGEGKGCDAIAPAGYFNFEERHHKAWLAMAPSVVKAEMILDSVAAIFDSTSGKWTRENARYARQYKVDYLVYEGGQHMQPYMQGEHPYNEAVWDAQIHPRMYDLYMRNFRVHSLPEVDCKLFMAFSYVSARKSRWGSWGHLENYEVLDNPTGIKASAPKYAALLDVNTSKITSIPIPRREPGGVLWGLSIEATWSHGRLLAAVDGVAGHPVTFRLLRSNGRVAAVFPAILREGRWVGTWRPGATSKDPLWIEARSGSRVLITAGIPSR